MFAKLKQKIQLEAGAGPGEGEKALPGASPRRISLTGSPLQSPLSKEKAEDGFNSSKEDLTNIDYNSKEDLAAALQKRTEKCRKLEAKVSECITVIKDNGKKAEKLEAYIEKQQDVLARRTQELNEQYQASRVQMSDNFKMEIDKLVKEKKDLSDRLEETEKNVKEKYFKREEEKEEIQQYTTQEMGKLKHMLILKEQELSTCQKDLQDKTDLLKAEQDRHKQFESLENRLKSIELEKSQLEEASVSHGKVVSNLTRERIELEEQLNTLKTTISQKSTLMSSLESKYADLESIHQTLIRNTDLQKNKLNQQVQEKTDEVEQLSERVKLLLQREQDETLSGDDRLLALQKERDGLEKKLSETREQLSQIKSSWSDKISHLEDQISHLNGKIAEDAEELTEAQNYTQTVKDKMQKEIDAAKEKLKASEKMADSNLELANRKESQFRKEKMELETEISKGRLEKVDLDTHLRAKLASVESQIMSMELERAQEHSQHNDTHSKLKKQLSDTENRLANANKEVSDLEKERDKLKMQVNDLDQLYKDVKEQMNSKEKHLTEALSHQNMLQEEVRITQEKLEKSQESSKSKSTDLVESEKEKDELMMRNAELSQQLTGLQQSKQDNIQTMEQEKQALQDELEAKLESEEALRKQCELFQARIDELSALQSDQVDNVEQLQQLEETIGGLEDQLAEKNKALKKQEQRLNDLKKTLQRELKVQSLPNDEPIDPKLAALTPPLPRKNSLSRTGSGSYHGETPPRPRRLNSHDHSATDNHTVSDVTQFSESANSYATQDFFVGQNLHPGLRSVSDKHAYGANNSHAMITVNDVKIAAAHGGFTPHGRPRTSSSSNREFDTRHLEKDINFQYLKHVVMKFMLSREHEAIHLIKAVSLLLRFTPEEQKLIRDTLQWKMSWFGGSQPPAVLRGQTSKIVPPSY